MGPRGWFKSWPIMWAPSMPAPSTVPRVWFHLRPHSRVSSVGQGVAEGKPGTESSDRSLLKLLSHKLKIFTAIYLELHTQNSKRSPTKNRSDLRAVNTWFSFFLLLITFFSSYFLASHLFPLQLNNPQTDRIYLLSVRCCGVSTWEKFKKNCNMPVSTFTTESSSRVTEEFSPLNNSHFLILQLSTRWHIWSVDDDNSKGRSRWCADLRPLPFSDWASKYTRYMFVHETCLYLDTSRMLIRGIVFVLVRRWARCTRRRYILYAEGR